MAGTPVTTVVRARSETEAAWMLAEGRDGTKLIAGGTDLMLHMERGKTQPGSLVDIRRAGMDRLLYTDTALHIGATATATALARWSRLKEHAYGLWEAAATLSVPQIRNMATLGGNLANASPAADMVPPVLAMGGVLEIRRGDEVRKLSALELATGPGRTVLNEEDLVTNVIVPRWPEGSFHHFAKLGFRDAQIIAVTSLALSCEMEGDVVRRVGIALGSVAPRVVRASAVEDFLVGQRLTREVGEEAMRLLAEDITPIDDVRSEAAFRLRVAQNYLGDALARAYLHAQGKPPPPDALRFLKDPAPRPPSMQGERTDVLGEVGTKKRKLEIVPTSLNAYQPVDGAPVARAKATKKHATSKKQASSKKGAATTKKATKKKATKKKATKKKATTARATTKKAKKATKTRATTTKKTKKATKKRAATKEATKKKAKKATTARATTKKAKKATKKRATTKKKARK